jgi:N-formylglutamate deformylase
VAPKWGLAVGLDAVTGVLWWGVATFGSEETVEAAAVGADPRELPFEFRAGVRETPLVVSFPHVGLDWPSSLGHRPQVSFPRNADYAIDRLYVRAEALGAATIRARYSRLVVDLNRAADDVSVELVPDHPAPRPQASLSPLGNRLGRAIRNRGVVWSAAVGNFPLFSQLSYAQFAERIDRYYRPYYRAIALLLARRVERFGYAVLLDAHSMPSSIAGDLVLGTRRGRACGLDLQAAARSVLEGSSASVRGRFAARWPLSFALDDPYQGGELIQTFGRPEQHVHALQLEVNRGVYMDELRCDPYPIPDPQDPQPSRASPWTRGAQSARERQRLAALVTALDSLVLELSRERDELSAAAE